MAQNVRAIKGRIGNIEDIAQLTRAMNAIAMTKVTRMKRRLSTHRPYLANLEAAVARLLGQLESLDEAPPWFVDNGAQATGVLVLNADRGMCGRYKGDLNRSASEALAEATGSGILLVGGEKARSYFERRAIRPLRAYTHLYDPPTRNAARDMTDDLLALYATGDVGRVRVVFMRFVSDLSQRLVVEDLLPVRVSPQRAQTLCEPPAGTALAELGPLLVMERLYAAMLETKACEDAIRRQAMKSATDNAEDLLKALTRAYNKARQQSITREIADILGGSEALHESAT
ncbi:MAG: ATP synthase F1 subunit gamma [Candidatus Bipolaricaulota bacterium]